VLISSPGLDELEMEKREGRVRTIHGKERQTISSHWSSLLRNLRSETPTPYLKSEE
jgi:hypothetical protein